MYGKIMLIAASALMLTGCAANTADSSLTQVQSAAESTAVTETSTAVPEKPQPIKEKAQMPNEHEFLQLGGEGLFEAACGDFEVYKGTDVRYLSTGEDFYEALLDETAKAESFILMEYFIVEDGEMLDGLLEVLHDRAEHGVEIKFICDGFKQSEEFAEKLRAEGIDCHRYTPPEEGYINNRDHRKLTVIDGKTAFVGGVNIADEYINKKSPYGHWKDMAVMLKGDGVKSCIELFFEQWDEDTDISRYVGYTRSVSAEGYVMPYSESPFDGEDIARDVYLEMIEQSEEELYITAPYLIIDDVFEQSLCSAAERGVKVYMIVPGIPDKPYMELLARPHYKKLAQCGVGIYRYDPGFIHGKVFVSDSKRAVVGSINLNNRSFRMDHENAVCLLGTPCISDIKADMLTTIAQCTHLEADDIPDLTPQEQMRAAMLAKLENAM